MPSRDLPILAPACRTVAGDPCVRGTWLWSVTAPTVLPFDVADSAFRGVLVAILVIVVVRGVVTALQQAAATFVALFARDDQCAERALRVLQTLQHRQASGVPLKEFRHGSRRRYGGRGR